MSAENLLQRSGTVSNLLDSTNISISPSRLTEPSGQNTAPSIPPPSLSVSPSPTIHSSPTHTQDNALRRRALNLLCTNSTESIEQSPSLKVFSPPKNHQSLHAATTAPQTTAQTPTPSITRSLQWPTTARETISTSVAPAPMHRPLTRQSTVFFGESPYASTSGSRPLRRETTPMNHKVPEMTAQPARPLRHSETIQDISLSASSSSSIVTSNPVKPKASKSTSSRPKVNWPIGTLQVEFENYREVTLPSKEKSFYVPLGRSVKVITGKAIVKGQDVDVTREVVIWEESLSSLQKMGKTATDTQRFLEMPTGIYILSEVAIERTSKSEGDIMIVMFPWSPIFAGMGESKALEVTEIDAIQFLYLETASSNRKRKLYSLMGMEREGSICICDVEVVQEEEGRPMKRIRWFGPTINEKQVEKGRMKKKVKNRPTPIAPAPPPVQRQPDP